MTLPLAYIVEDDTHLGEIYEIALQTAGFDTVYISDSTTALDIIRQRHPDLVMLDMQMPTVSGADILNALRADPATAHLNVMVASASFVMMDDDIVDKAQVILQKPVSIEQIMQFARRFLEGYAPHKPANTEDERPVPEHGHANRQ